MVTRSCLLWICSFSLSFAWTSKLLLFLAELCYLTGNIFGVEISCGRRADDMRMMCGWCADDMRARFRVRFHWQMSSTHRLHIIRMTSASLHVVRTGQQLCIKPTGFLVESWAMRGLLVGSCCALGIDIEDGIGNNIGYLITSILMFCRKTDPRQFKQAVFWMSGD